VSRTFWLTAFAVAVVVQTVALYAPRTPQVGDGFPWDKVVHVTLFLVVAAFGVRAGIDLRVLVALLVGQAVVSEILQAILLSERSGDFGDLAADLGGAAAGLVVGHWWVRRAGA